MPKILEQKKIDKYPIKLFKYVRSPYWWFSFFVHKSYSANGMEYQSSKLKDVKKAEAYSISYFKKFNLSELKEMEQINHRYSKIQLRADDFIS